MWGCRGAGGRKMTSGASRGYLRVRRMPIVQLQGSSCASMPPWPQASQPVPAWPWCVRLLRACGPHLSRNLTCSRNTSFLYRSCAPWTSVRSGPCMLQGKQQQQAAGAAVGSGPPVRGAHAPGRPHSASPHSQHDPSNPAAPQTPGHTHSITHLSSGSADSRQKPSGALAPQSLSSDCACRVRAWGHSVLSVHAWCVCVCVRLCVLHAPGAMRAWRQVGAQHVRA